jgi:hypothetical protein
MAFKLAKEDRDKLIDLLVDDYAENSGIQELKECVKEFMTKGLGELKPYCEMKDEELIKQLKPLAGNSIGELVDKLVQHGISQKEALMIAHEYSHHVEELEGEEEEHLPPADEMGEPQDLEEPHLPE